MMTHPTLNEEKRLWQQGFSHIAGVDEVGRGSFAGPVVAAAVILPKNFNATNEINDSKLLTYGKREKLAKIIKDNAVTYAIAEVDVSVINRSGIGKATQQAFAIAIQKLFIIPDFILIDAYYIQSLSKKNQKPIVHGDRLSISIAAASILAKVYRDEHMKQLPTVYAVYDFAANKGYGTKKHQEAIRRYGLCDIHRTSFDLTKFTNYQKPLKAT